MWIAFAFGSALFAGLTAILAKCGIKNTDSNVATAIRTIIVLIFSWIMVFVVGAQKGLADISGKTLLFLIFSGLSTGASWLCYFKALQLGDVNKVTPIDKSSTILTMLLAFILLREALSPLKVAAMIAIGVGTYLMIQKKETEEKKQDGKWLIYAIGCGIRQSDFDPWKGWNPGCQLESWNGDPDDCGTHHGMGGCVCDRKAAYRKADRQIKLDILSVIRN